MLNKMLINKTNYAHRNCNEEFVKGSLGWASALILTFQESITKSGRELGGNWFNKQNKKIR